MLAKFKAVSFNLTKVVKKEIPFGNGKADVYVKAAATSVYY